MVLTSFYNFSYFHIQFSTFPFTIFTPFPFFPCLCFPDPSAKISRSQVSEGHSAPPPGYATANKRRMLLSFEIAVNLVLCVIQHIIVVSSTGSGHIYYRPTPFQYQYLRNFRAAFQGL